MKFATEKQWQNTILPQPPDFAHEGMTGRSVDNMPLFVSVAQGYKEPRKYIAAQGNPPTVLDSL